LDDIKLVLKRDEKGSLMLYDDAGVPVGGISNICLSQAPGDVTKLHVEFIADKKCKSGIKVEINDG